MALWGPDPRRYNRLMALLERGPYAAVMAGGVFFAHAGFPLVASSQDWAHAFESLDDTRLMQLLWAECDVSANRRGAGTPWGAGTWSGSSARPRSGSSFEGMTPTSRASHCLTDAA